MFQKGDENHMLVMNEMMTLMKTPEAMKARFESKKDEFDNLSEE